MKKISRLNIEQAIKLQEKLKEEIILQAPFSSSEEIKTIAGSDLHFSLGDKFAYAGIVVLSFPEMEILESVVLKRKVSKLFPYLASLLSFREIPYLIPAFKKLKIEPDVIFCDGQGIAHPRKMGLATHLGIILDKPTVGCAKSLLYGRYEKMPESFKGSYNYLKGMKGEIIGAVLRTKDNVRPVFVSPGHKMNLKLAIEIVLKCCPQYRLPEPLRYAHQVTRITAR